jgi:hypothetical protein
MNAVRAPSHVFAAPTFVAITPSTPSCNQPQKISRDDANSNGNPSDQDSPKEECQEGNPVLLDGLWSLWNWYASSSSVSLRSSQLTIPKGRTTFVNTLCGKKVLQSKDADDASNAHLEEGVRIKPITVG